MMMENREYPLWENSLASRNHSSYQGQHSVEEAKEKYLTQAGPCPLCKTPADKLSWIYLVTPEWTWQTLCGKAGWMTVCDRCKLQIDFFVDITNQI